MHSLCSEFVKFRLSKSLLGVIQRDFLSFKEEILCKRIANFLDVMMGSFLMIIKPIKTAFITKNYGISETFILDE